MLSRQLGKLATTDLWKITHRKSASVRRSASGGPVKTTIRQKNSIPQEIHIFCHGGQTQFVISTHTDVEQPAHLAKQMDGSESVFSMS